MFVRKAQAGSTSLGYTWDHADQVVEVPDEHAILLVAIRDGGFTFADAPPAEPAGTPPVPVVAASLFEPGPVAEHQITEPAPPPSVPVGEDAAGADPVGIAAPAAPAAQPETTAPKTRTGRRQTA